MFGGVLVCTPPLLLEWQTCRSVGATNAWCALRFSESVQPRVQALLRSTADAGHQSASAGRLRNGQRLTTLQIILSRRSATLPLDRQAVAQRGGRLEYFTIACNRFNWPLRYRLGCRSWMRTPLSEPRKSCPLWRGSGLLASSPTPFGPQLEASRPSRQRRSTRQVRK